MIIKPHLIFLENLENGFEIEVLTCSSLKSKGLDEIWDYIQVFINKKNKIKTFLIYKVN